MMQLCTGQSGKKGALTDNSLTLLCASSVVLQSPSLHP